MELWEIDEADLQAIKDAWGMSSWSDQEFFSVYYDEPDCSEHTTEVQLNLTLLTDEEKEFLSLLQGKI